MTDRHGALSALQVALAQVFFGLDGSAGYLVAGGSGLLALDLITRPTMDLDLFTAIPTTSVTEAGDAYVTALRQRGYDVVVTQDAPTFRRLVVARGEERTVVDLAVDSPPLGGPVVTVLGPTVGPLDLAARKLLALFGRAEARDFADVFVLCRRFGTDALVDGARAIDQGFDLGVLAEMIRTMHRFADVDIPLGDTDVRAARVFFARWSDDLTSPHGG